MSKKEKEVINEEAEVESTGRIYELGYLLVPTIAEDEVAGAYGNLREYVTNMGGDIITDEMPKMINLAYQMLKVVQNVRSKYDTAYFGWIKFEMDAQKVLELKKVLDLEPTLIRFLIIKTVRENTIASKRFVFKDSARKVAGARNEEGSEPVEINKEEIDKEIDAMVSAE